MGERLGQHFLNNPEIARSITEVLNPKPEDAVLEIGPGQGFLTSYLIETGASITGVELDAELAQYISTRFKSEKLKIINKDFLKFGLEGAGFNKICGNVPYQISGKIIEKIVLSELHWEKCVLMIPKAVAKRVCAEPGTSDRSVLSVLCDATCEARYEFDVSKDNFDPPPKIESAVISLKRLSEPLQKEFYEFVRAAFFKRRKSIKNSLSNYFSMPASQVKELLDEYGIGEKMRAQQLGLEDFKKLSKEFVNRGIL
jgi:16S rRNA (adenine1518-N6/adenine1519-N6)-dimethyltransferase